MASVQQRASGLYLLSFRFQGRQFQRSLDTRSADEATRTRRAVEQRLKLLADGTLRLPPGAAASDLWEVLLHGRLPEPLPKLLREVSLGAVRDAYLASYPPGTKEPATLKTEEVHVNNLIRILGRGTRLHAVRSADLEHFIRTRLGQPGNRGGTIKPDTVRKELDTFRLLWRYAQQQGHVIEHCPVADIRKPKRRQRPPFQTWEQIEAAVDRGGLTPEQVAELWDCLFLREAEIAELLEHVKVVGRPLRRFTYIYPALCFCAYTGARRSEMFRCQVQDVANAWINLREKKREPQSLNSFRLVPQSAELRPILDEWLAVHPGGQYLFCKNNGQALDDRTSREAFAAVTKSSQWAVLRGFHILRHSFASNLARSGRVSQAEIDEMMGHQTEEMTRRYRHLYPEDKVRAINCLTYQAPTVGHGGVPEECRN
jgi:integrase